MGPILAVLLPLLMFYLLKFGFFNDPFYEMPKGHFYIVSVVSLLALIIAIAVGIAGNRVRNIKVTFLSLSFISLAVIFLIHGLATPHMLLGENHVSSIASPLSLLIATIWLWLSAWPTDNKLITFLARKQNRLVPVWTAGLCIFGIIGMMFPHIVDIIPLHKKPIKYSFMILTIFLNGITMYRYFKSYRFSRFPLQISIVYSTGWFMVSQWIMVTGEKWKASWWIYHFLLLASVLVMLLGLVKQFAVKGTLSKALKSLFTNDPFERMTGSMIPSIRALVVRTENKDTYTAGHTFRVTMYAMRLAEELHLKPEQLRVIVQGGLLHDVGKVKIPDSILNKPGKLTPEERSVIEEHPVIGYEVCKNLGFMKEELSIIRSHHEKWDGSGYPDRLYGEEISLYARITAVADVYDALTSERSYRKAWPHEKAMNLIIENRGTHFDPKCVDAWIRVCEKDPSVYQYPAQKIKDETTAECISYF